MGFLLVPFLFPLMLAPIQAGTFWYFNDLHYDPTYGARNESCFNEPHTAQSSLDKPDYLAMGSYFCDASWALVEDSIVKMKDKMAAPDFIIWAGDTGHHTMNLPTILDNDLLFEMMLNVTQVLLREFPNIRVLPLLGNHDWMPKNKLPPKGTSGDLYDQLADLFLDAKWLSEDEATHFRKAGFYATTFHQVAGSPGGLRTLVLNTNLYMRRNTAATGEDPGGQFRFMRKQLELARENGEKVFIFVHVGIGNKGFTSPYDETFREIVIKYANEIICIIGAHEHRNRFRLIFAHDKVTPVAYEVISPALTPWKGGLPIAHNPANSLFRYTDDFLLDDMEILYLNLSGVDETEESRKWKTFYTFRETYGGSLNVSTFSNILQGMKTDQELFQEYYRRLWANIGEEFWEECDDTCRKYELCVMEHVLNSDLDACLANSAQKVQHNTLEFTLMLLSVVLVWLP